MWLKEDGFVDQVRGWWDQGWWGSYSFPGSPSHIMASKLKALKMDLIQWNSNEFGNIQLKKQQFLHSLHELETTREMRHLTEEERLERARLISDLVKNTYLDEIC